MIDCQLTFLKKKNTIEEKYPVNPYGVYPGSN
jgi:hypothetical protein